MFLNPERSMSHSMEHDSEHAETSHNSKEYHSDADGCESEEASTESEDNVFASIWYPSLPPAKKSPLYFPKPYLHNQDFRDSNQALKYIKRYFNHEMIHQSLQSFPSLSKDFIYFNTYMETNHFDLLQFYINKSIWDRNAKWVKLLARYSTSAPNVFIVQYIL